MDECADLVAYLRHCGLDPVRALACCVTLDPEDATDEWRSAGDLARADLLLAYLRMQDGARFGTEADVLGFVAEGEGRARLVCAARLVARPPGIAPGDLVYDPALAELLHNFITRAHAPVFYDAVEPAAVAARFPHFTIAWPSGSPDCRPLAELVPALARG